MMQHFSIWPDDGKSNLNLNSLQKNQILNFQKKLKNGEYSTVTTKCFCGSSEEKQDIIITEKDRYGLPMTNLLCPTCGTIRSKVRLDDASLNGFYQNEYRDIYNGKPVSDGVFFKDQLNRGNRLYKILKQLKLTQEIKQVFEIGCGAGGILYPFHMKGHQVSGCDLGKEYLMYGKEKGLDLYEGSPDAKKTPHGSQDLIVLSHLLEHLPTPLESLSEYMQLLRPNGLMLIEVPGIRAIKKTYVDPIQYFQNAHIYNFHQAILSEIFLQNAHEVIFGNEHCVLVIRKKNEDALEIAPGSIDLKKTLNPSIVNSGGHTKLIA